MITSNYYVIDIKNDFVHYIIIHQTNDNRCLFESNSLMS